jgi:hypothetical protein
VQHSLLQVALVRCCCCCRLVSGSPSRYVCALYLQP